MDTPQADDLIRQRNRLMASLTNITPGPDEVKRIERVRMRAKELGSLIALDIAASREKSLAMTHLEETVMWAVKAILMEDPPAQATKNFPIDPYIIPNPAGA